MSGGLRELLGLPEISEVKPTAQTEEFSRVFRQGMARVNQNLQIVAAQAAPSDHQALDAQRIRLYEAFHKASAQIDPRNPAKAEPAVQRVIAAVTAVDSKASEVVESVAAGGEEWAKRSGDFDDAMLKIGELEDMGHPKAATFRKLGEAIRQRANEHKFKDASAALDQLRPKLGEISRQMKGPDGDVSPQVAAALPEAAGIDDERLREIIEIIAKEQGLDLSEIGDLEDLPADVLETAKEILGQVGPGPIAEEIGKLAGNLLNKLIDALKNFIAKRRVPQICLVTVQNFTNEPLTLKEDWKFPLGMGGWSDGMTPADTIPPGGSDTFQAESPNDRKKKGVKALMNYRIGENDDLEWQIMFTNPRDGKIDGESNVEGDTDKQFRAPRPKPTQGDTAKFVFKLNQKGVPEPEDKGDKGEDDKGGDNKGGAGGGVDIQASCHITVSNKTDAVLNLIDQGHERGDFMTVPATQVKPGESIQCVSVETANADDDGCKGFMEWEIEGAGAIWRIEWDNPERQKNTTTSTLSGDGVQTFRGLDQIGQGDENVPTVFTLSGVGGGVVPPVGTGKLPVTTIEKETTQPVSNVEVVVGEASATTQDGGTATIELAPGSYSFQTTAEGYAPASGTVEVAAGDNQELLIELSPGSAVNKQGLTILVKDEETGEPIEEAVVKVGDQSDITVSTGLATVELPVGSYSYEVTASGYETDTGNVQIIDGDNPELVVLMKPGAEEGPREGLTIFVRDKESGEAVEGASVKVGDQSDTTSSNGLATVELPVGQHAYDVTAEGYQPETGTREIIQGDNEELLIDLIKGGECSHASLAVIVQDESTSANIAGATVNIGGKTEQTSGAGLSVVTLEPGAYDWEVTAEGYSTATGTVEVQEGDDNELIVQMQAEASGSVVGVFVTDLQTGEALESVDVFITDPSGKKSAQTDASGRCELEVTPGAAALLVRKNGYQDATGAIEVPPNERTDVEIQLAKEAEFTPPPETPQPTLRKGDESGDGWVEYLQQLLNKHLGAGTVNVTGTFDQATYDAVKKFQGSTDPPCQVDGIVGNETWSMLRAQTPREAVGVRQQGEHEEHGAEARWATEDSECMKYDPASDAFLMVAYSVGDASIAGFYATVRITGSDGTQKVTTPKLGPPAGTTSTGDGQAHEVRVEAIAERFGTGSHKIEAYLPDELGGDLWTGTIEVPEVPVDKGKGGTPQVVDDKPETGDDDDDEFEKEMAHVEVTVVDDAGKPVGDALIRVSSKSGGIRLGNTKSNGVGVVSLSAYIEEEQTVTAAVGNKTWDAETIAAGSLKLGETYKVKLNKTATADIGILDVSVFREGSDDPVEGCVVELTPFNVPNQFTDKNGNAKFENVPVGKYKASAIDINSNAKTIDPVSVDAEVLKDETTAVSIVLPRGGVGPNTEGKTATLEVRVDDRDGSPLPGAKVRISSGPSTPPDGTTDSGGIAKFELEPGDYHVNAAFEAFVFEPRRVRKSDLVPGKTHSITMKKIITGGLEVTVTQDGAPVAGATVSVSPSVHAAQQTSSEGQAYFELAEGSYTVNAVSADGKSSGTGTGQVKSDVDTPVPISLTSQGGGDPTPKETGTVKMNIIDQVTGSPVEASMVSLSGPGSYTKSGSSVIFEGVLAGKYNYTIMADSYLPREDSFELEPKGTLVFNPTLEPLVFND